MHPQTLPCYHPLHQLSDTCNWVDISQHTYHNVQEHHILFQCLLFFLSLDLPTSYWKITDSDSAPICFSAIAQLVGTAAKKQSIQYRKPTANNLHCGQSRLMQLQAKMCVLAHCFCYVIVLWTNLFWNRGKCSIRVTIYIAIH